MHQKRCPLCGTELYATPKPANDNQPFPVVVYMPSTKQLRQPIYLQKMAQAILELGVTRHRVRELCTDTMKAYRGQIISAHKGRVRYSDAEVENAFPAGGDDRWFQNFIEWADQAPRYQLQIRLAQRYHIVDLTIRLLTDKPYPFGNKANSCASLPNET